MEFLSSFSIYNSIWSSRAKKACEIEERDIDTSRLRIVLGVGRSGTTWVANTLARSTSVDQYFEEPLFHIQPRLLFSRNYDLAASKYGILHSNHRLIKAYEYLSIPGIEHSDLIPDRFVKKDHSDQKGGATGNILIKEVHSLLATESLLKQLSARFLFLMREPVKTVDSILSAHNIDSVYLVNEFHYMNNESFYSKVSEKYIDDYFALHQSIEEWYGNRMRVIMQKVFSVYMLNSYLKNLGSRYENAITHTYEEMCSAPDQKFEQVSSFFGLDWQSGNHIFKNEAASENADPYSINRDTISQLNKKLSFITEDEVKQLKIHFDRFSINLS